MARVLRICLRWSARDARFDSSEAREQRVIYVDVFRHGYFYHMVYNFGSCVEPQTMLGDVVKAACTV